MDRREKGRNAGGRSARGKKGSKEREFEDRADNKAARVRGLVRMQDEKRETRVGSEGTRDKIVGKHYYERSRLTRNVHRGCLLHSLDKSQPFSPNFRREV